MRCVMRLVLRAFIVVLLISSCLGQKFKRQADPLLYEYIYGGKLIRPSNFGDPEADFEKNENGNVSPDNHFFPGMMTVWPSNFNKLSRVIQIRERDTGFGNVVIVKVEQGMYIVQGLKTLIIYTINEGGGG